MSTDKISTIKREIKFRVWDNVDYMSNGFYLSDIMLKETQFTEGCIVMQYTGLKDKKGREIYEGDIIEIDQFGKAEVVFESGCFMAKWIDDPEAMMDAVGFTMRNGHKWESTVLGNIYENHLLIYL